MLRCVLLLIITCAFISDVVGQDLTVNLVDLQGKPIDQLNVRASVSDDDPGGDPGRSDPRGIAQISRPDEEGRVRIWVNYLDRQKGEDSRYIGRRATIKDARRLTGAIAVPIWTPKDVGWLAGAVILNPSDIAVFVQRPRTLGDRSRVVLKLDRDVDGDFDGWLLNETPDVPRVRYPQLARALFEELETGDEVPPEFDAALQRVWDEVDRQNGLTRFCRNQVATGQFPPRFPPQQPYPPPSTTPPYGPPPTTAYPYPPLPPPPPTWDGRPPGRTTVHWGTTCWDALARLHHMVKLPR